MATLDATIDALHAVLARRVRGFSAWQARVPSAVGEGSDAEGPEPVASDAGTRTSRHRSFDAAAFAGMFAAAARDIGTAAVALSPDEAAMLAGGEIPWIAAGRSVDELARIVLLAEAARHLSADAIDALVEDCYRHGELRERVAVLRALPVLPRRERLLALAIDACRTSVQPVFEAIAAENPFPAAYFPEASFNQMVLKAVFTGMAVGRIIGLDARRTPELARMAEDYASERRAAGRPVPADLALLGVAVRE